jgi:hypothetical protein
MLSVGCRSPRDQALAEKAEAERQLCRDWLRDIMRRSPEKVQTKAELRAEAVRLFNVSKQSFDFGWIAAIEETGNRHWYEPLPRSKRKRRVN